MLIILLSYAVLNEIETILHGYWGDRTIQLLYERAFNGKGGMYNGQLNGLFTVIQKLDKIMKL